MFLEGIIFIFVVFLTISSYQMDYLAFVYTLARTKLGKSWTNFGPPMLYTRPTRQNETSLGPIDWIINEYLLTLFFISISVWWCYWHPVLSTRLMTAVIISCVVFRHFSVSLFLAARKKKGTMIVVDFIHTPVLYTVGL